MTDEQALAIGFLVSQHARLMDYVALLPTSLYALMIFDIPVSLRQMQRATSVENDRIAQIAQLLGYVTDVLEGF